MTICALCYANFEAHTSYGLCPQCWSRDKLREYDRLESAEYKARKQHLPATLTLAQWLATTSDFNGKCAYCLELPYHFITMVEPDKGLTWENAVPICRACAVHKECSFDVASLRVKAYLAEGAKMAYYEQVL